jgi:hypothetical protein
MYKEPFNYLTVQKPKYVKKLCITLQVLLVCFVYSNCDNHNHIFLDFNFNIIFKGIKTLTKKRHFYKKNMDIGSTIFGCSPVTGPPKSAKCFYSA